MNAKQMQIAILVISALSVMVAIYQIWQTERRILIDLRKDEQNS